MGKTGQHTYPLLLRSLGSVCGREKAHQNFLHQTQGRYSLSILHCQQASFLILLALHKRRLGKERWKELWSCLQLSGSADAGKIRHISFMYMIFFQPPSVYLLLEVRVLFIYLFIVLFFKERVI